MKLGQIGAAWNDFWFKPQSPEPMSIFRIFYGLIMLEFCFLIAPDLMNWYSDKGVLSLDTAADYIKAPCINLITWLQMSDSAVLAFFAVFVIAVISMTVGFYTRTS